MTNRTVSFKNNRKKIEYVSNVKMKFLSVSRKNTSGKSKRRMT